MQAEYRVELDAFQGPMDLLLYLIRRHEVDIHDIPIALITERYLVHIEDLSRVDIDLAGEFLVTAATLMEIKSRMIAAETERADRAKRGESAEDDAPETRAAATDPRSELVAQLLEYKRLRDAADELERRREDWERRQPVRPAGVPAEELREAFESMDDELDLDDLSLSDIMAAFERIASTVNMDRLGEHEVLSDDTPIELHAEDLMERLRGERRKGGQLSLFDVLHGRTRAEMVGLLLAMLDLVRQQRLTFKQDQGATGVGQSIVLEAVEKQERGETESDAESEEDREGTSMP